MPGLRALRVSSALRADGARGALLAQPRHCVPQGCACAVGVVRSGLPILLRIDILKGRGGLGVGEEVRMKVVARMRGDFSTKFGIPRQSGLVESLESLVVFEPEYRDANALRGIEQFSHLWLIWQFSENADAGWSPTVRPPKLGGNTRLGVFATRSPFRPNPIGLSSVKLLGVEQDSVYGLALRVSGADLMDGTPVLDIKPYVPYTDAHPDAAAGYTAHTSEGRLQVDFPETLLRRVPEAKRNALLGALAQDPRPGYQADPKRVYGFPFAGQEIRFRVADGTLTVLEIK